MRKGKLEEKIEAAMFSGGTVGSRAMTIRVIIDDARKDYLCRKYNITAEQITPELMEALRQQAKILRSIKKEYGTVNYEDLLWFLEWFGNSAVKHL